VADICALLVFLSKMMRVSELKAKLMQLLNEFKRMLHKLVKFCNVPSL